MNNPVSEIKGCHDGTSTQDYILMSASKAKLIYVIIILMMTIVGCQKQEDDDAEEIAIPQLVGEVLFVQGQHVRSANINSLSETIIYGEANYGSYPKWSNDGTKFAYIFLDGDIDSTYFLLRIFDYNSGNLIDWKIGNSRFINIKSQLSWSPDDRTVIFLSKWGVHQNTIIYLNTLTGDTTQSHFNLERDNFCSALAWNPIENKIAVNIQNWHYSSDNTIWMVEPFEITPSRQFPIGTDMMLGIEHMDWNSNGTKLTYSFDAYGEVFIVNADGSDNKKVPDIYGYNPRWSNDGKFLMYQGSAGLDGSTIIPGLFVTDLNGSFEKLLSKNAKNADWY